MIAAATELGAAASEGGGVNVMVLRGRLWEELGKKESGKMESE
jgi:hypothetical protein